MLSQGQKTSVLGSLSESLKVLEFPGQQHAVRSAGCDVAVSEEVLLTAWAFCLSMNVMAVLGETGKACPGGLLQGGLYTALCQEEPRDSVGKVQGSACRLSAAFHRV